MNAVNRSMAARLELLAAAVLFSTAGAVIKLSSLTNWQLAGFRAGVAALALFFWMPRRRGPSLSAALGVSVAYAATMVAFVAANKLTSAANAIFLQSTAPFYVLLLGPLVLREPVRRADLAFMLALAAGFLAFFHGVEPSTATAPDPAVGNLVAAGTGLTWALTVVGLRWLGRGDADAARTTLVGGNVLAFALCLPFALPLPGFSVGEFAIVAYLGTFQIGLAYVLLARAVPHVTALEATLLLLLEPVLNPIWAWLVLGEVPNAWSLIGGAVILSATVVKTVADTRRAPAVGGGLAPQGRGAEVGRSF